MSSSVLSQLVLDDVVDGSSPDLTSIPHSRVSEKLRANQYHWSDHKIMNGAAGVTVTLIPRGT
jgi:hypothetical protein